MRTLEVLLLAAMVFPAQAGEYVVFTSGFRQLIERHETVGGKVRLFSNGGFVEMDAVRIAGFEPQKTVAAQPPTAPEEPRILPSEAPPDVRQLVDAAADKYGIDPRFLHGVAAQESAYRPDAISPAGAIGVMQLMPETAEAYGADPYDPAQNVDAGTRYLRDLLLMYKDARNQLSRALAAYNAGPGAVARYRGVPPYRETQQYVRKILGEYLKSTPPRKRS
jgi:soluble lytic murein transglycosylase-like protein